MPLKETCRMEERIEMLRDWESGNWTVSELCRRYGICRDTWTGRMRRSIARTGRRQG